MKKFLLSGIIIVIFSFPLQQAYAFTDLEETHQNYAAIEYLQSKGIIEGYSDGSIKPNNQINRAEALKVILKSANMQSNSATENTNIINFKDVKSSDWFYQYVSTAYENKLIKGYSDNTFKPANIVNLAEALKISFEAFGITPPSLESQNYWYEPYTKGALERNLIGLQNDGETHPEKALTRAALFEIIYRIMYLREKSTGEFDISTNWATLSEAKLNFQIKHSFNWQLIENEKELIIWHPDNVNYQLDYMTESPLGAFIKIVLNDNSQKLTAEEYFQGLSQNYCGYNCSKNLNKEIPSLIKTLETNQTFYQEQHLYLPNSKILIIYIQFGKDKLKDQFEMQMNKMLENLKYTDSTDIDDSNMEEIISTANQNINVDGKGIETIKLFADAIIIETDPIGVGAGVPVDYYYSEQANITIKYLREPYDTILDIEDGKTKDF